MGPADAERYLRITGEHMLADGGERRHSPGDSALITAARALAAVGAIDGELAQEVVDDYALAMSLRSEHGVHLRMHMRSVAAGAGSGAPQVLLPRRVVACDRVIERPTGVVHVRSVSLSGDATAVAVTLRPSPADPRPPRRPGRGMMVARGPWGGGGPPTATLRDDRGGTATAHFAGGGSDYEWTGHLRADQPLAVDTAWIELDTERIELVDRPTPVAVAVESLPPEDPAVRHLWSCVAALTELFAGARSLAPAIDALVAAGALRRDDPVLAEVSAVALAIHHGGGHAPIGGAGVPEPWRAMLGRRGRTDGPIGTLVLGAVTPEFDGLSLAVLSLDSSDDAFEIEVEVVPDVNPHLGSGSPIDGPQLAWWAADDRGNHYLGTLGSWSGGDLGQGTVGFWPALDPRATRLRLMPTAQTARAVITVALPWAAGEAQ